ncbi:HAD family hydrolase [Williamsia phyllosphaerae]|uniref:HAD family hydrolase n=1 Tax=Williamsia phyllosphaerae TaxID=885042 RepID=A0ABQ1V9U2_9NOCA|nr:HAD family hydrolase [Williamsia phyllosphaerae]GGF42754.1 hypothetical protein GCM10007298_43060 [Williamsia phyllosphaerae]
MTALVATDLDRTLIYSTAAAELGVEADDYACAATLRCVEIYQGRPQSFMSHRAVDLLDELDHVATVVPVTTRSVEQFRRVELPFTPDPSRPRFAVAANGGEILVDGVPDPAWRAEVERRLAAACASVSDVHDHLAADADPAWLRSLRIADGLFCYAVVELDTLPPDLVDRWREWARPRGWNVSRQGRKIYVMPDPVTKSAAVAAVREHYVPHPTDRLFAAGDGVLDRPLLMSADRAIRPRHGELQELSWHHPTLSVTSASGIAAAEEILDCLLIWSRETAVVPRP